MATAVAAHPERLIGFVGVDPMAEDPEAIRRTIRDAVPRCEPVYQACMELDVPLLMHTGIPLPIIAAHLGVPWVMETIAVAVRHPNVYLDVSALPTFKSRLIGPLLALCLDRGLADRLLFGSDFPLVDPADYARRLRIKGPGWLLHQIT